MGTELYHWGIPGMKWGIRRYQNEDGTLTEEGRLRYRQTSNGYKRLSRREQVRNMSTQELNTKLDRMRKENEYLSRTESNATKIGKKIVFGILTAAAIGVASEVAKGYMTVGAKALTNKAGLPSWNVKENKNKSNNNTKQNSGGNSRSRAKKKANKKRR